MELVNTIYSIDQTGRNPVMAKVMRSAVESAVLLISPIVPHISEEIWAALGNKSSVLLAKWPSFRKDAILKKKITIVVQVNGKLRSRFEIDANASDNDLKKRAVEDEKAKRFIGDKPVRKITVVKKKLVNIVV
jgi:leucyl-tRNA synthetase